MTYIATGEGWSYLAVLLDLPSRRVVGWAISATNDTELALAALHRAVRGRHRVPPGLVHHTDRGSAYASGEYRAALTAHAMVASMSRVGDRVRIRHKTRRCTLPTGRRQRLDLNGEMWLDPLRRGCRWLG